MQNLAAHGGGRGRWLGLLATGLAMVALSACGGTVQERLGMTRRAPDEFQVVRRQPLVVPPDYRLPEPGTPSPAQSANTASQSAQATLFGGFKDVRPAGPSAAERALVAALPGSVAPDIRATLLTENSELTQLDESRFLFILDWQRARMTADSGASTPLDPVAEAERLEAEGRSARVVTRRVGSSVVQ